ncbi:MarR family transcriptional regulator [Microbaculum marinum]|uniref:MarR family transcriptional regulator n=1 Tax=Microbaculum marinum TaxID=1764581 RepID=A0AAW9RMQ1_9HYPH
MESEGRTGTGGAADGGSRGRSGKADGSAEIDYGELPSYIGYLLRRAQATIFRDFERALGDIGLTPGAFGILMLIRANPGITQMDLANAFGIDKSTLTPVLNRLEAGGLVRREQLAHDRRYNALFFEEARKDFFEHARKRVRQFEQSVADRLAPDEQAELVRLIGKLQAAQS